MKLDSTRVKVAAAVMLLAALPSLAAPKRRAVNHPAPNNPFNVSLSGTVIDATTGAPVSGATVTFINAKTTTTKEGKFEINNINGFGTNVPLRASRSGYDTVTENINGSGTKVVTLRLQGRPTVSVRLTNGNTMQLDDDSIRMGYVQIFSGYISSTTPNFCKSDGTKAAVSVTDMKRIIGPAVLVRNASCCSREDQNLQRVKLELRNGESNDMIFTDTCAGFLYDLLGRDHASGDQVFLKFSDIAEVVFP